MLRHGRGHFGRRERLAVLDLGDRVGLQQIAMLLQKRTVVRRRPERAQRDEDVLGVAQIRRCVFDRAAEALECLALAVEHRAHARFHRQAAEIGAPRHAHAAKFSREGLQELRRIDRQQTGVARIRAAHDGEQQRDVLHVARERAGDREPEPRKRSRVVRRQTHGRPEADDVVEVAGIAQRAGVVAAVRDRQHAGRERDGCSAAGPAGRLRQVIRV